MRRKRKHIACKVGDHSGLPPRDIAPDRTPITVFTDDGEVWMVADLATCLIRAVRRQAREEGVNTNIMLSRAIVEGFTRLVEGGAI